MDFRNKPVDPHRFSMIPSAQIPRAKFARESMHKTTFDAGYVYPVFLDEVLPGDHFQVDMTFFARLATPLFPIMDNLTLSTFWFFVPNRLVWDNWQRFMGERDPDPDSSIDYLIPQIVSPASGYTPLSLFDYLGLPTVGQVSAGKTVSHSALPLRMYNLIFNEWFRDENLQDSLVVHKDDGPDPYTDYSTFRRGKRHDYFTSCLPWPQKGDSVTLPLGSIAPVVSTGASPQFSGTGITNAPMLIQGSQSSFPATFGASVSPGYDTFVHFGATTGLEVDLSAATAATINQIRQSFQVQRLLERDARGGTRYTEILRSHFGVISPDARLQRPEYLGGGTFAVNINPVAQTSSTLITGSDTPLATLAAIGTAAGHQNGFSQSFVEHGYVFGLVSVQADLSYQQGLRKLWSRQTRYDFYFPVFAHLGEQAVLNQEIYVTGDATDQEVFGYQERWAEYRYMPSMITGLFRSTTADTLDAWHLAQHFTSLPTLNDTFIKDTPPVDRVVAVGDAAGGQQFIFDSLFKNNCTRPMPLYSVPGLIDHF